MSTIDLSKLIARKKFLVPVKSSAIHELISEQLKFGEEWESHVKRLRSGIFRLDILSRWIVRTLLKRGLPYTKGNIAKMMDEFTKSRSKLKLLNSALKDRLRNLPYEFHYVVEEESEEWCVCEVTCFPTLYAKLVKGFDVLCNEADIQDARLRCEEFLIDIFVGGLGGKEIVERREVSLWEFLINDVDCRHITDRIHEMLENATGEVLLMGWVGTDCLPKLKELKNRGVTIQAVTHKPDEIRSPPKDIQQGYTNLIEILGTTNVSIKRELHGRAIIVDNKALIGSMDLNAPSLSGEHREFAVYTEDVETVKKMRAYFKNIFVPLKNE